MKKVNWGIIGLGAIALQFANGFKFSNSAKRLSIASRDLEKVKRFQKRFKRDSCTNYWGRNIIWQKTRQAS